MKTMKNRIAQLDRDHRNSLIALASHAESADDLNDIIGGLDVLGCRVHGELNFRLDIEDVCAKVEKAVTQWENITADIVDGDDWNHPDEWSNYGVCTLVELDRVFKKDENTIIIWDNIKGGYTECSRKNKET